MNIQSENIRNILDRVMFGDGETLSLPVYIATTLLELFNQYLPIFIGIIIVLMGWNYLQGQQWKQILSNGAVSLGGLLLATNLTDKDPELVSTKEAYKLIQAEVALIRMGEDLADDLWKDLLLGKETKETKFDGTKGENVIIKARTDTPFFIERIMAKEYKQRHELNVKNNKATEKSNIEEFKKSSIKLSKSIEETLLTFSKRYSSFSNSWPLIDYSYWYNNNSRIEQLKSPGELMVKDTEGSKFIISSLVEKDKFHTPFFIAKPFETKKGIITDSNKEVSYYIPSFLYFFSNEEWDTYAKTFSKYIQMRLSQKGLVASEAKQISNNFIKLYNVTKNVRNYNYDLKNSKKISQSLYSSESTIISNHIITFLENSKNIINKKTNNINNTKEDMFSSLALSTFYIIDSIFKFSPNPYVFKINTETLFNNINLKINSVSKNVSKEFVAKENLKSELLKLYDIYNKLSVKLDFSSVVESCAFNVSKEKLNDTETKAIPFYNYIKNSQNSGSSSVSKCTNAFKKMTNKYNEEIKDKITPEVNKVNMSDKKADIGIEMAIINSFIFDFTKPKIAAISEILHSDFYDSEINTNILDVSNYDNKKTNIYKKEIVPFFSRMARGQDISTSLSQINKYLSGLYVNADIIIEEYNSMVKISDFAKEKPTEKMKKRIEQIKNLVLLKNRATIPKDSKDYGSLDNIPKDKLISWMELGSIYTLLKDQFSDYILYNAIIDTKNRYNDILNETVINYYQSNFSSSAMIKKAIDSTGKIFLGKQIIESASNPEKVITTVSGMMTNGFLVAYKAIKIAIEGSLWLGVANAVMTAILYMVPSIIWMVAVLTWYIKVSIVIAVLPLATFMLSFVNMQQVKSAFLTLISLMLTPVVLVVTFFIVMEVSILLPLLIERFIPMLNSIEDFYRIANETTVDKVVDKSLWDSFIGLFSSAGDYMVSELAEVFDLLLLIKIFLVLIFQTMFLLFFLRSGEYIQMIIGTNVGMQDIQGEKVLSKFKMDALT